MDKTKQKSFNRKLPSINSSQCINGFDESRSKSTGKDNRKRNNLSPYQCEFDRKNKVRTVLRDKSDLSISPNNSRHDVTNRNFRIKDYLNGRNTNSLYKELIVNQHSSLINPNPQLGLSTINSTQNTIEKKKAFRQRPPTQYLIKPRPFIKLVDKQIQQLLDKLRIKYSQTPKKPKNGFRKGKFVPKVTSISTQKTESNSSFIMRELNQEIQKPRIPQFDKSLENYTEEYFKQLPTENHLKSRAQIEFYVSTVKKPARTQCTREFVSCLVSFENPEFGSYNFNIQQEVNQGTIKPLSTQMSLVIQKQKDQKHTKLFNGINGKSQFDMARKLAQRKFLPDNQVRMDFQMEMDQIVQSQSVQQ